MNEHRITLDHLIRIAEDVPWETFEAMSDGRLLLEDRAQTLIPGKEDVSPLLWVFEMRIGLHFERPMQAIMSCGQFVRMRSAERWAQASLKKLDPCLPSNCLYPLSTPAPQWPGPVSSWRPSQPVVWLGPNQMPQQAMQAMQAQQQVSTQANTAALQNVAVNTLSGIHPYQSSKTWLGL